MALDTYGHVFDELDGAERMSAEQAIRKARKRVRPWCDLRRIALPRRRTKPRRLRGFRRALFRTRTGDPLLTMEVLYQLS
jgi:hypothetical protein